MLFSARAGIALFFSASASSNETPVLNKDDIAWIGEMIFTNECNRQITCLTAWNTGEDFPSLGIGHFIWFQAEQDEIFEESFPDMITHLAEMGVTIPDWIMTNDLDSPWPDRDTFLADMESTRMQDLRTFLYEHTPEQTAFIISRFENALATMIDSTGPADKTGRKSLENNFYAVANSSPPYGLYALIDYVNFKGIGVSAQERYREQGWGLKQVLESMEEIRVMEEDGPDTRPLHAFVTSARHILETRVSNAPPERNESRWLTGWNRRLDTYLPPGMKRNSNTQ